MAEHGPSCILVDAPVARGEFQVCGGGRGPWCVSWTSRCATSAPRTRDDGRRPHRRGGGGVAGRAGAGEHRARRYDEVEEAQRRLRQRGRSCARQRPSGRRRRRSASLCYLCVAAARLLCARRSMRAARAPARLVVALWLCRCWQLVDNALPQRTRSEFDDGRLRSRCVGRRAVSRRRGTLLLTRRRRVS